MQKVKLPAWRYQEMSGLLSTSGTQRHCTVTLPPQFLGLKTRKISTKMKLWWVFLLELTQFKPARCLHGTLDQFCTASSQRKMPQEGSHKARHLSAPNFQSPNTHPALLLCRSRHKNCPGHPCFCSYPGKRSLKTSYIENISYFNT